MCALTADDPMFQPGFEEADTSVSAAVGLYGYYGPAPHPNAVAPLLATSAPTRRPSSSSTGHMTP